MPIYLVKESLVFGPGQFLMVLPAKEHFGVLE
jgi:hypothetical protein